MFTKVIGKNQEPGNPGEPAPTPPPQPLRPPAPSAPSAASRAPEQPVSYTAPGASAVAAGTRNILSSDVEIKGTVRFTNDLLVDGRIDGEIHSDGSLTVGENARLRAEIHTGSIFIHGKVHGNVTASERVELRAGSEVVGDIKAKTLFVEAGAVFVGKSDVGTPSIAVEKSGKPAAAPAQQAAPAKPQQAQGKPAGQPQGSAKPAGSPQQGGSKQQNQGDKQKTRPVQGGLFNKGKRH
jgi:cytoskeletal protein CcmA (bactofilin family)